MLSKPKGLALQLLVRIFGCAMYVLVACQGAFQVLQPRKGVLRIENTQAIRYLSQHACFVSCSRLIFRDPRHSVDTQGVTQPVLSLGKSAF
jgi:hypothetical protein